MREIKFRAWHLGDEHFQIKPQMLYDDKPGDCLVFKNQGQNIKAIMQFTGFYDVHGKEIYEGDLVRYVPYVNKNKVWKVVWGKSGGWHIYQNDHQVNLLWYFVPDHIEVVGNIYENPELVVTHSKEKAHYV